MERGLQQVSVAHPCQRRDRGTLRAHKLGRAVRHPHRREPAEKGGLDATGQVRETEMTAPRSAPFGQEANPERRRVA